MTPENDDRLERLNNHDVETAHSRAEDVQGTRRIAREAPGDPEHDAELEPDEPEKKKGVLEKVRERLHARTRRPQA